MILKFILTAFARHIKYRLNNEISLHQYQLKYHGYAAEDYSFHYYQLRNYVMTTPSYSLPNYYFTLPLRQNKITSAKLDITAACFLSNTLRLATENISSIV